MNSLYNYSGSEIIRDDQFANYDRTVKGIAHRGFSEVAPENTLPAYTLAREKGFYYVETDISFTSDGVPVCLHDATIDRTSNGSGNINNLTWAQVQQYDFGSWKSSIYAETKIPSFEQFIALCKKIMLHPYIELKDSATYSQEQITSLVTIVNNYGMSGKVTWISFNATYLGYVKNADSKARLGLCVFTIVSDNVTTVNNLKTTENEVFIDARFSTITTAMINIAKNAGIPLELWIIETVSDIVALNPYITGITSNSLLAGKVLYDSVMS